VAESLDSFFSVTGLVVELSNHKKFMSGEIASAMFLCGASYHISCLIYFVLSGFEGKISYKIIWFYQLG